MKKAIACIVAGSMAFSLAACNVSTNSSNSVDTSSEATTEFVETGDDYDDVSEVARTDFRELLTYIQDVRAGSAGASLRAEEAADRMVAFSMAYGSVMSEQSMEAFISDYLATESDEDQIAEVKENYETVVEAAYASDESLETDVYFAQLANAMQNVLDEL